MCVLVTVLVSRSVNLRLVSEQRTAKARGPAYLENSFVSETSREKEEKHRDKVAPVELDPRSKTRSALVWLAG